MKAVAMMEDPFPTTPPRRGFRDSLDHGLAIAAESRAAKWRLENAGKITQPKSAACECGRPAFFLGLCRDCSGWSL